jgi:hypothetical protein
MTKSMNEINEILDTTKSYEQLSFLKGIAGLYYRAAIAFTLGLFGLLILEAISDGSVFYDKEIVNAQFTLVQIGQIVVFMGFIGDLSFAFTRFITDQLYTEYLSQKNRGSTITRFSLGVLLVGVLFAVTTILLTSFDIISEAIGWSLMGIFLGGVLLFLARSSHHTPTYIPSGMLILAGVLISTQAIPGPYWVVIMMVMIAAAFIASVTSYFYAERHY